MTWRDHGEIVGQKWGKMTFRVSAASAGREARLASGAGVEGELKLF